MFFVPARLHQMVAYGRQKSASGASKVIKSLQPVIRSHSKVFSEHSEVLQKSSVSISGRQFLATDCTVNIYSIST